jgi:hypothetical protein
MTLTKAMEILKHHQRWRLGEIDEMPYKPLEITEALDVLLSQETNIRSEAIGFKKAISLLEGKLKDMELRNEEENTESLKDFRNKLRSGMTFSIYLLEKEIQES